MIFQINGVIGNLTTAFLLKSFKVPVNTLLWVMTVVSVVGAVSTSATAVFSGVRIKSVKEEEPKYFIIEFVSFIRGKQHLQKLNNHSYPFYIY